MYCIIEPVFCDNLANLSQSLLVIGRPWFLTHPLIYTVKKNFKKRVKSDIDFVMYSFYNT